MDSTLPKPGGLRRALWIVFAVAALVVWPVISHVTWLKLHWWSLHGRLAFLIGLLVFLAVAAAAQVVGGAWRHGLRWLVSRHALSRLLTLAVLAFSAMLVFYAVEQWRGRRAWAQLEQEVAQARDRSGRLDSWGPPEASLESFTHAPSFESRKLPPGEDYTPEKDFAKIPLLAPLEAAAHLSRDGTGGRREPDLGRLQEVLRLGNRLSSYHEKPRVKLAPWLEGEPTDLGPWLAGCLPPKSPTPAAAKTNRLAAAAAVLEALAPFEATLEELRAQGNRPYCRLPFDAARAFFAVDYGEQVLVAFMRTLRLRATARLALDQNDAALQDIRLVLRLAYYLEQHPSLFGWHGRAFALADGLQPLWEGLQARRWSMTQIAGLQGDLAAIHPLQDYSRHVRLVAYANASFVESIIPTAAAADSSPGPWDRSAWEALQWVRCVYPKGWSLQDQAAIWGAALRLEQAGPGALVRESDRAWARVMMRDSADPFFPVYLAPKIRLLFQELREYLPFSDAVANLATLACALERERLSRGEYPETLQALVPGFLASVPSDPMSGAAYCYHRVSGQQYVLYSVGSNRLDDQGRYSPRRHPDGRPWPEPDLHEADWVWSASPTARSAP